MKLIIRKTVLPFLSLLCVMGWQTRTSAHGVVLDYQSTQAYEIQAAYDTGEPMANAQVVVFSPDDPATPWLTSTTDAQGRFLFSPSAPGNWEVQVRQAGHGDILVIPVETGSVQPEADTVSTAETNDTPSTDNSSPTAIAGTSGYSPLQKSLMIGAVVWGCVGTALFFSRGKR
jgi:nickel transport protein